MLKSSLMASLTAGALALNLPAPVATAFAATGQCGFDSVQNETVTGQNYEGVAYGIAVDDTGAPVTIRCFITVNGTPAPGASISGSGTGVAVAAGPVSFEAADGADVELCTEVNGNLTGCADSTNTQLPPQEVLDALNEVLVLLDPMLCIPMMALNPVTLALGLDIVFDAEGDLFVNGDMIWDCPVYMDADANDGVFDY